MSCMVIKSDEGMEKGRRRGRGPICGAKRLRPVGSRAFGVWEKGEPRWQVTSRMAGRRWAVGSQQTSRRSLRSEWWGNEKRLWPGNQVQADLKNA